MSPAKVALLVIVWLGCAGCGTSAEIASVGPQSPEPVAPGTIQGPFVQAGTVFQVKLDEAIDTYYTPPGTPLTATVQAPIVAQDGRVVVPAGAKVRGTLASVGTPDMPVIRVQLGRIDSAAGAIPLHAAVRAAEHFAWAGPPTPDPSASYVFPYGFTDYGSNVDAPGGPGERGEGRTLMQPRELRVPAGAAMQLVLTEPLVLPGARLAP